MKKENRKTDNKPKDSAGPTPNPFGKKTDHALRYNEGKSRVDQIPAEALLEVGRVSTYGVEKYGLYNWQKGQPWGNCIGAALRHIYHFMRGEDIDPESGIHHLAHAAWNLLALIWYQKKGLGEDDRIKAPEGFDMEDEFLVNTLENDY